MMTDKVALVGGGYGYGDRVRVIADIDLQPHGVVPAGAEGTVVHLGEDGYTEILMDTRHTALDLWGNRLWLIPPYTDDEIAAALVRINDNDTHRVRTHCVSVHRNDACAHRSASGTGLLGRGVLARVGLVVIAFLVGLVVAEATEDVAYWLF